jgi:hypothetical protein
LLIEVMTTNAGRFSAMWPRPYWAQAPIVGRPGISAPLRKKLIAGAWLTCSVCMDLMKQSSSATFAVWGMSALTVAPLSPWHAKGSIGARSSLPLGSPVIVLKRFEPRYSFGTGLPCILWSAGFQSKRSTCVGAPFMNR